MTRSLRVAWGRGTAPRVLSPIRKSTVGAAQGDEAHSEDLLFQGSLGDSQDMRIHSLAVVKSSEASRVVFVVKSKLIHWKWGPRGKRIVQISACQWWFLEIFVRRGLGNWRDEGQLPYFFKCVLVTIYEVLRSWVIIEWGAQALSSLLCCGHWCVCLPSFKTNWPGNLLQVEFPVHFHELQSNTDLKMPPSNWLRDHSSIRLANPTHRHSDFSRYSVVLSVCTVNIIPVRVPILYWWYGYCVIAVLLITVRMK